MGDILLADEEIVALIANKEMKGRFLTTGERWDVIKKAQLNKVFIWGDEPCPHLNQKEGLVAQGLITRKRRCDKCWQTAPLSESKDE